MSESNQIFKAIETRYHGYMFRSRLEARWAVFLDELKVDYRYEPQGYVLEETPYLPDFYLPQLSCFLEIKGKRPTDEEMEKSRLLAFYTGKDVVRPVHPKPQTAEEGWQNRNALTTGSLT